LQQSRIERELTMISWLIGIAAMRATSRSVRSSRSCVPALDCQSPFGGLRTGDAITSEQKAFGALVTKADAPTGPPPGPPTPVSAGNRSWHRRAAITWSACKAMSYRRPTQ